MLRNHRLILKPLSGQRRNVSYFLPTIKTLENIKSTEGEFSGLFSNKSVNQLWFDQGNQLVSGLNQLLEGQGVSSKSEHLKNLIEETFSKPELYGAHLYASSLYNLQFFFELLKPSDDADAKLSVQQGQPEDLLRTPSIEETYSNEPTQKQLRDWIISSFGSIPEFRTLLLNSAKAINGNGHTWLVAQASYLDSVVKGKENTFPTLAIVNTYNSGTILDVLRSGQITRLQQQKQAKAEFLKKRQAEALASRENGEDTIQGGNAAEEFEADLESEVDVEENPFVLGTTEEAEAAILFQNKQLIPLLSIDASPKSYLLDYGVYGKQRYLDNVWNCIDWAAVDSRAPPRYRPTIDYI